MVNISMCSLCFYVWLFVWMKYVHDLILSMYHMMGLWWGHDNLYLFIQGNLVMQDFSFGSGDTENYIFLFLLCGKILFSYG